MKVESEGGGVIVHARTRRRKRESPERGAIYARKTVCAAHKRKNPPISFFFLPLLIGSYRFESYSSHRPFLALADEAAQTIQKFPKSSVALIFTHTLSQT